MVKKLLLILFIGFHSSISMGQSVEPIGKFIEDSLRIGEKIHYSLSIKYPKSWQVIFTDSTFNYGLFEYEGKEYFPTRADSNHAFDSVVYALSSFEIDTFQTLKLPIYVISGNDSIEVLAQLDSIIFNDAVLVLPDSLKLKANFEFQEVNRAFNYPYFLIITGVLAVIALLAAIIFGKKIKSQFRLYRLKKDFDKFKMKFQGRIAKIKNDNQDEKLIENVLLEWKSYMEKLEDRPFTKYTSKEIVQVDFASELQEVLRTIDQSIYGHTSVEDMQTNFQSLLQFTEGRFDEKRKEILNG
ncbi:MAG: hypothetical protein OCD76_20920 [Reichenbachiella sp.]